MRSTPPLPLLGLSALVLSLVGLSASGCAADAQPLASDEANFAVGATVLSAKLYADPHAVPAPSCDKHTLLTLIKGSGGTFTAKLENRVTGGCEIYIAPDPRSYVVRSHKSCGSTVYAGASGDDTVTIEDHRGRLCEDLRPALIELEETRDGAAGHLYGKPTPSSTSPSTPSDPTPAEPPVVPGFSRLLDVHLYAEPQHTPDGFCDSYTKLVVGQEGDRVFTTLSEELSATSACEIAVVANARTYECVASRSCGSRVYECQQDIGRDMVRIQDNRARVCEDLRPALVEVEERVDGQARFTYGTP